MESSFAPAVQGEISQRLGQSAGDADNASETKTLPIFFWHVI